MASIELKIQPFTTPNFVRLEQKPGLRQDGFHESPAIPIANLDYETLSQLCDDFRAEVFKKAKKPDSRPTGREGVGR